EDIPTPVLDQLADWLDRGEVGSADGRTSYTRSLSRLDARVMLLGGGADTWSPPEALRETHRTLGARASAASAPSARETRGAPQRTEDAIHVLDRDNGATTDYGHVDIVFGLHAPTEVFPRIHAFLRRADHD
ncbi:MAG: hypothetical protein IT190_08375, partial [Microbacteriaceae bacterium]|nr:hypothetical protein [Microbacteriaceae bacterium]